MTDQRAKQRANDRRREGSPGHVQPQSSQLDAISGHTRRRSATVRTHLTSEGFVGSSPTAPTIFEYLIRRVAAQNPRSRRHTLPEWGKSGAASGCRERIRHAPLLLGTAACAMSRLRRGNSSTWTMITRAAGGRTDPAESASGDSCAIPATSRWATSSADMRWLALTWTILPSGSSPPPSFQLGRARGARMPQPASIRNDGADGTIRPGVPRPLGQ